MCSLVTAPTSTKSSKPSLNISVWMPRPRRSVKHRNVASGICPMPAWRHALSPTTLATCRPICSWMLGLLVPELLALLPAEILLALSCSCAMGAVLSTKWVTWDTCTKPSPSVRGTEGFTSAMTVLADSTAATATSTDVPSEQNPWRSGGDTFNIATSTGM